MANAHSFPLLRLPDLAREHVVTVMDVREQYLFSTLSKKSKRITQNGTRRTSYYCKFDLCNGTVFTYISKIDYHDLFPIVIVPFELDYRYPHFAPHVIKLTVKDAKESSIELLESLNGICRMSNFKIECRGTSNDFVKQFLMTVKNLKITVHNLEVAGHGQDNALFEWVMKNCKDVKEMDNRCFTTPDFKFDHQKSFTFESCYLQCSPFLTLDHLTRLFWNCRVFRTEDDRHEMTNRDMNQLVKLWMEGGSKLEYIQINANRSFNFQQVMTDVEKVPVQRACLQNVPHDFDPGNAFKIHQHNQKEAVVCRLPDKKLIITTHFNEKDCDLWTEYESSDEESEDDDYEDEDEEEDEQEEEGEDEDEEEEDVDSDN